MAIQDIYPTALRLLGRPVLVVGAGPVAARRAKGLLDAGAASALWRRLPARRWLNLPTPAS